MRSELLIGVGPGEWRAAWLEDGSATELYVERGMTRPAGSIHLGRVVRLAGGLDAALVDIGEARPGFLPLGAAARPDEGARAVVQIRREAQGGKGALLSTRLAAREGQPDTARLAEQAMAHDAPAQLYPAPGFAPALALRLPAAPEGVITDDPAVMAELRAAFPTADLAHAALAEWPIDLDAAFEQALSPTLALPGGGSLHIEETRAAVLIDVDSGSPEGGSAERNRMAANLAAATAIARQIRLRQLGGGIVIDFAGVEGRGPRERIRQAMIAALPGDPTRPEVLGWTRLGHLEIVRPRRGRPLGEAMLDVGSTCKSGVALACEALRLLYREARARPAANWCLDVEPGVDAALRGPIAAALQGLEARLGRSVELRVRARTEIAPFDIAAL